MEIYNSKNRIKFTSISEKYQIPKTYKYKLSVLHSSLIEYVSGHFVNTNKYKQKVADALNVLTYCVLENEVPPFDWSTDSPLGTMPDTDMEAVRKVLGGLYLTPDAIEWDIKSTDVLIPEQHVVETVNTPRKAAEPVSIFTAKTTSLQSKPQTSTLADVKKAVNETQKEDLYIKAPMYPQFDYNRPWLSRQDGPDKLVIYTTLPEIPTKQNEISVTTNVSAMTASELDALYPTKLIHTRAQAMYEPVEGMTMDDDLGIILPIGDYSESELIDNIIRYPHLYKLQRCVGDEIRSFYNDIEIDGELYPISEMWDELPESKIIPKQSEYIKEYVVRRYILEEEHGIHHNYPMYGTLLPYLTLFMPLSDYISKGYTDTEEIARQCVLSRVSFKQSRNPIIRRLKLDAQLYI